MFEEFYAQIMERIRELKPQNGFEVEHLFPDGQWEEIGDGTNRQRFGKRFAKDVKNGDFPGVSRNEIPVNPGGNEARYNYDPGQDSSAK